MFLYAFLLVVLLMVGFHTIGVDSRYCYEGQYLSHDTSCSKYQACQNRRFIERECEFGVWNERAHRCEFSTSICRVRTENSWHALKVPDCNNPKNKNSNFPHPFDCSKFYKCDKSVLIEKECPPGHFWNQEDTSCERESTCEAVQPRYAKTTYKAEQDSTTFRRHNKMKLGCDKVDEDNDRVENEKPSSRKYVDFFNDEDEDIDVADSFGV